MRSRRPASDRARTTRSAPARRGADPNAPSRRARWDQRHAAREPIESSEPDPTLVGEIGSLRPGRALDLGAGDGRNAIWLARHGWQVTAVDLSLIHISEPTRQAEISYAVFC